ncbi:root phototropism protein 2 isoform X1 [Sesamum indicum]|uniref:Root phototropism protein 2 isoform X1 n=1 Tax=Sesamum indicum TaxID=4182 RepID=A0A6I9TAS4_SESIN|nr:root phototropism protein 2 isoform X1 [Sesamum indicum]
MPNPIKHNSNISLAMERAGQWVFSQELPTDVVVEVGEMSFSLHKFMLVGKSNHIRELILESKDVDCARIDLSGVPGGAETFETVANFCYGFNFEITVHNVAALRCAAEYLQMTDSYCKNSFAGRTEDFLSQVALTSMSGALAVLKSCEELLPMAEDLKIVQRCVEIASAEVCFEANFPSRSPQNWWVEELTTVGIAFFAKIIASMTWRGAKVFTLASVIIAYAERSQCDLVNDHSRNGTESSLYSGESDTRTRQRELIESIVALLPLEKSAFPIRFLCSLLRTAICLRADNSCKNELENRISMILEHVTADDLVVLSFTSDGELFDLESVRTIISGFVEKEKSIDVFSADNLGELCSRAMLGVAKTVDTYLGKVANCDELSIAKFNGIANSVPKAARKLDDHLYRAVDIYLKAHPYLDEIKRLKVCSVMDPLRLSHQARVHASQNNRLPVQIVLHALHYDQLKLTRGIYDDHLLLDAPRARNYLQIDVSLVKENEALRTELLRMRMCMRDMQRIQGTPYRSRVKKHTFFSSLSKTLGILNPFKHARKDTSNVDDEMVDSTTLRRGRFSIS